MLNLHNILLISPPQNHPPLPPPPSTSPDHQKNIQQQQEYSSNNNDNTNNNNNNYNNNNSSSNLHESSSFGGLKKFQESRKKDVQNDESYTRACRDCGNRAKKECNFRRCRTCCKTRGYNCATHLRSTWVPAAKRREKKLMTMVSGGGGGSSGSSCGVKRPRVFWSPLAQHVNASAASPSTPINASASTSLSINTGPCYQEENFKRSLPGQVQAPAEFRCIRVTSISDDEAEVGYVATVKISGHVFKGYLYDHGIDEKKLFACISKMQMENDVSTARNRDSSSSPIGDHSAYAASGN